MDKPTQPINEIVENIKTASAEGYLLIWDKLKILLKSITDDLQRLVDTSNYYKGAIEKARTEWQEIKKEVDELEKKRGSFKEQEKKLDERNEELKKEADSLASLYKVLDNRRNVLDEREGNIVIKEKRLKRRIK